EYGTRAPQVSKVDFRSPRALRAESRSAPNHSIVVQRTGMTPVGKAFRNEQGSVEDVFWDFQINILGEKDDTPHAFCYACAILHGKEGSKMFPGCSNPVERIEKHTQGSLFMCGTVQGCKRSCLSRRDLKAHQPRPYKS
ncbi:hypothetical protein E2I00_001525, partial [Balaenoptera physalus]